MSGPPTGRAPRPDAAGRRRTGAILCLGGGLAVVTVGPAFSFPEEGPAPDEPMRTAGGRYAYVAPIDRDAPAHPLQVGSRPATRTEAPPAPAIVVAALLPPLAASAPQDQEPAARPTPVLTPIQGPLLLDGRYVGDISGAVDPQGDG